MRASFLFCLVLLAVAHCCSVCDAQAQRAEQALRMSEADINRRVDASLLDQSLISPRELGNVEENKPLNADDVELYDTAETRQNVTLHQPVVNVVNATLPRVERFEEQPRHQRLELEQPQLRFESPRLTREQVRLVEHVQLMRPRIQIARIQPIRQFDDESIASELESADEDEPVTELAESELEVDPAEDESENEFSIAQRRRGGRGYGGWRGGYGGGWRGGYGGGYGRWRR